MAEPHVCIDADGARLYPSIEAVSLGEGARQGAAGRWVFDRRGVPVVPGVAADCANGVFVSADVVAELQAEGPIQLMREVNRLYGAQFQDPRDAREFVFATSGATLSIVTDAGAIDDAFGRADLALIGGECLTGDWGIDPEWLEAENYVAVAEPSWSPPDDDAIERLVGVLGRRGEAELLAVDLCSPYPADPPGYVEATVWRMPATAAALRELRAWSAYWPHVLLPVQGLAWMVVMHPNDEVAVVAGSEPFVVDYAQDMQALIDQFEEFFIADPWQGAPPGQEWRMYRHLQWMRDYVARH